METTIHETGFLFANPTFASGFGSIIDLSGTSLMYNRSSSPNEADLRAIASDWAIVGQDIEDSVEKFETEESFTEEDGE